MTKYIVSDEHRFIYFAVPKVACSSIKTALLPLFNIDATPYKVPRRDGTSELMIHKLFDESDYQLNKRQLIQRLREGEYRSYFKFAFVRNPWDRLVSCYLNKLSEEDCPGMKYPASLSAKVYCGMPFSEFVEVVAETPDSRANLHFRSQSSMICGTLGGEERRHPLVDFVGRFENLQADFKVVAQRIGGGAGLQLGHLMRSNRNLRSYAEFYDGTLESLVSERYREDIGKFGYSF